MGERASWATGLTAIYQIAVERNCIVMGKVAQLWSLMTGLLSRLSLEIGTGMKMNGNGNAYPILTWVYCTGRDAFDCC